MASSPEWRSQLSEVIFKIQLNIRYVLSSCLLDICNSAFDEPYVFSGFSYPRDAVFWDPIAGSSDALCFSFLLFQEITCAGLVESGG